MENTRKITTPRDIRKIKWYEEIEDYFKLDHKLLERAIAYKRSDNEDIEQAKKEILSMFMSEESLELYEKIITTTDPQKLTDVQRSESWKEYVLVCIAGERNRFQEMHTFNKLIYDIIKPMLKWKESLVVLDYGCGSSLFTRMLSQDFQGRVKTISADVCKYSVEFSVARNQLFNPNASGILIEDVNSFLELEGIDVINASDVFEHLPNATKQIQGLLDSLAPGGILIENYAGHSSSDPHKSDTFSAYQTRDHNLDMINDQMTLLYGILPKKQDGIYGMDVEDRFWIKQPASVNDELIMEIKQRLGNSTTKVSMKLKRKIYSMLFNLE